MFSVYAPDGGLFIPSCLPSVTTEEIKRWSTLTFPELVYEVLVSALKILNLFIVVRIFSKLNISYPYYHFSASPTEVSDVHLKEICSKSFAANQFDDSSYIPVKKLGSAFIAELFHGPTFCLIFSRANGYVPITRVNCTVYE